LFRTLGVLIVAAMLEIGGDVLVRLGMESRAWMFAVGAASLVIYGIVVNKGGLDFGRLIGVYIAVLFVVSQIVTMIIYRELPALRTIVGGTLIVAGGLTIIG
jgi:drug/metabolite transporter superfamily protein YnfA